MSYHGITGAAYRIGAADGTFSGSTTAINDIGAESGVTFEDPEGVKPPVGGQYWGGRRTTATVEHLDATAAAALETGYKQRRKVELTLTLVGGSTVVVTGTMMHKPQDVKGAAGGARGHVLTAIGFSAS